MNKTDRLLAIVLELQGRRVLRAEDLAAQFETSVRTIYRDIQALSEAGVPIIGTPGTGYSLMEGYFLPPIRFTIEEAMTLLIGTDFVEQRFDDAYRDRAIVARKKLRSLYQSVFAMRLPGSASRCAFSHLANRQLRQTKGRISMRSAELYSMDERSDFIIRENFRIPREPP